MCAFALSVLEIVMNIKRENPQEKYQNEDKTTENERIEKCFTVQRIKLYLLLQLKSFEQKSFFSWRE